MPPLPQTVLVTGDVIQDHQIYLGGRFVPDASEKTGTQESTTEGGAALLHDILDKVCKIRSGNQTPQNCFNVQFGLRKEVFQNLLSSMHGYSLWKPFSLNKKEKDGRGPKVWRMAEPLLGYGSRGNSSFFYKNFVEQPAGDPSVVVIDDAGQGFRDYSQKDAWPQAISQGSAKTLEWVVLKMARPLGQGDLWRHLSTKFKDKLVMVVSIEDIRREAVRVSRGISWERTALDLVQELWYNPAIKSLLECRHLIVHFGTEGALHAENTGTETVFSLTFDPTHLEQESYEKDDGQVIGLMVCFTSGIVDRLIQPDHPSPIASGIWAGLSASRTLHHAGYGDIASDKPGFPMAAVVKEIIKPSPGLPVIKLPNPGRKEHDELFLKNWTIMTAFFEGIQKNPRPLFGIGRRVAIEGPKALSKIPCARFGKLFTVDRKEIESLRGIRTMIKEYVERDKGKKPLSIAVFGPPGAGKSFGIEEIARGILGEKAPFLTFNLSQFRNAEELIGAFHQVRDKVLEGTTPVVFWDEFDSEKYKWLQYLLAPMQDGKFLDGQINHPIGKSVFVFAGGTSYDMENFGPKQSDEAEWEAFKLKKGPDFISRLSGYLNVLGPNKRQRFVLKGGKGSWVDDESDICYPIRRAILLRALLGIKDDKLLEIDHGILSAIIETKRFLHGARSMEKIVSQLKMPNTEVIRRSDIPSEEILSMHADPQDFAAIVNRNLKYQTRASDLAPFIHDFYRQLGIKEGWITPANNRDYEDLPDDIKEDNRAAAARLPNILDLVGLYVVPLDSGATMPLEKIEEIIEANIELLAEAEHNYWMDHKLKNGWTLADKRDDAKKQHNCLRPYMELDEKEKKKDRNSVRMFPEILKQAKYKIVARLE
jgi:hypothetical protein